MSIAAERDKIIGSNEFLREKNKIAHLERRFLWLFLLQAPWNLKPARVIRFSARGVELLSNKGRARMRQSLEDTLFCPYLCAIMNELNELRLRKSKFSLGSRASRDILMEIDAFGFFKINF